MAFLSYFKKLIKVLIHLRPFTEKFAVTLFHVIPFYNEICKAIDSHEGLSVSPTAVKQFSMSPFNSRSMAFATSTLLYLAYCWKTKYKEKKLHYYVLSGLEDNCSTYFENREVNHTFPQLRSVPCSEDVNEHSTVCAFSFLSCLIQGLQAESEFKRHVHNNPPNIHNKHLITLASLSARSSCTTLSSLLAAYEFKLKERLLTSQFKSQITLLVNWSAKSDVFDKTDIQDMQ